MGNSNEEQRIRNRHSEEIAIIEAKRDDNERKREIERFAKENNLKKYMKKIEAEMKKDLMMHEGRMEELNIQKDDMIRRNNNERKKDEETHEKEMKQLEDNFLLC